MCLTDREWETTSPRIDAELELRREWWINHGCSLVALYGDDGEMQCNNGRPIHPTLDFKRDPLEELKRWVDAGRMARGERALAAAEDDAVATMREALERVARIASDRNARGWNDFDRIAEIATAAKGGQ